MNKNKRKRFPGGSVRVATIAALLAALVPASPTTADAAARATSRLERMLDYNANPEEGLAYLRYIARLPIELGVADPDRIEVLHFFSYNDHTETTEWLYQTWRYSLPARVHVIHLPVRGSGTESPDLERAVYYTAFAHGRGARAHQALMARRKANNGQPLDTVAGAKQIFHEIIIPRDALETEWTNPQTDTRARAEARWAEHHHARILNFMRQSPGQTWPTLVIGGEAAISTNITRNPARTYQLGNLAVAQIAGDAPRYRIPPPRTSYAESTSPPTNNEAYGKWLVENHGRGTMIVNAATGNDGRAFVIVSEDELWQLDRAGNVERTLTLRDIGGYPHWSYETPHGTTCRLEHPWRYAPEFRVLGRSTFRPPPRYGALLLGEWLTEQTDPVRLATREGNKLMLYFDPGAVTDTSTGTGTTGRWRLKDGRLTLDMNDGITRSWPWRLAAEQAQFRVPARSFGTQPRTKRHTRGTPMTATKTRLMFASIATCLAMSTPTAGTADGTGTTGKAAPTEYPNWKGLWKLEVSHAEVLPDAAHIRMKDSGRVFRIMGLKPIENPGDAAIAREGIEQIIEGKKVWCGWLPEPAAKGNPMAVTPDGHPISYCLTRDTAYAGCRALRCRIANRAISAGYGITDEGPWERRTKRAPEVRPELLRVEAAAKAAKRGIWAD